MVEHVRDTEKLLGTVSYSLSDKVKKNRKFARSLFVVEDACKGDIITKKNVRSIRPGYGLHPKFYYQILGKKLSKDVTKGEPLTFSLIENFK